MHKKVKLIMQPFNSGLKRKKMYTILNESDRDSLEHNFFDGLKNNYLNNELIESHWHQKYSSTKEFKEGQLHIIKTTINHFAQKWMIENYPEIHVWGIWREPEQIVDSIIRNDLFGEWYDDAIEQIIPTVQKNEFLYKYYSDYSVDLNSVVKKTAFLISVRSHFFFKYLRPGYVIQYELFKKEPNYLNLFLQHYGLSEMDISEESSRDFNITGEYLKDKKKIEYSSNERDFLNGVFNPIKKLMKKRHNIS